MLRVSIGAGVLTPACPSPEDSLHVTHDGAVARVHPEVPPRLGERLFISGSPLILNHNLLAIPIH